MQCPTCGNNVPEDATFCPVCGTTIERQQVQSAPQQNTDFVPENNGYENQQQNNYQQQDYNNQQPQQNQYPGDAPNVGFAVLGFFFPLIGLILYLVWKQQYPLKAKSCGKGALIGFIFSVVCGIIMGILISTVPAFRNMFRFYF